MTQPWGLEAILEAIRSWYEREGRLPTFEEWEKATPNRPAARTVERYGKWIAMLADAIQVEVDVVPTYQLSRPQRAGAQRWDPTR